MNNMPPISELKSLSRVPRAGVRWHQRRRPFWLIDTMGVWAIRCMIIGGFIAVTLALVTHFNLALGILLAVVFLTMAGCASIARG